MQARLVSSTSLIAALPALSSQRTRLWLLLLVAAVVGLSVLGQLPGWQGVVESTPGITPVLLLVLFLSALACEYVDSSMGMGYGTTLTPLLRWPASSHCRSCRRC